MARQELEATLKWRDSQGCLWGENEGGAAHTWRNLECLYYLQHLQHFSHITHFNGFLIMLGRSYSNLLRKFIIFNNLIRDFLWKAIGHAFNWTTYSYCFHFYLFLNISLGSVDPAAHFKQPNFGHGPFESSCEIASWTHVCFFLFVYSFIFPKSYVIVAAAEQKPKQKHKPVPVGRSNEPRAWPLCRQKRKNK